MAGVHRNNHRTAVTSQSLSKGLPPKGPYGALHEHNAGSVSAFLLEGSKENIIAFLQQPGKWAHARYVYSTPQHACCVARSLWEYLDAQPLLGQHLLDLGIDYRARRKRPNTRDTTPMPSAPTATAAGLKRRRPPPHPAATPAHTQPSVGHPPPAAHTAGAAPIRPVNGSTPPLPNSSGSTATSAPVQTVPQPTATGTPTQTGASGAQTPADISPSSGTHDLTLQDEVDECEVSPSDISDTSARSVISAPSGGSSDILASTTPPAVDGSVETKVVRLLPESTPVQDNDKQLSCHSEADPAPLLRRKTETLHALTDHSAASRISTQEQESLVETEAPEINAMKKVFHDFSDRHIQIPLQLLNTAASASVTFAISHEERGSIKQQLMGAGPRAGQALTFTLLTPLGKHWYAGIVVQKAPPRDPWWTRLLTNLVRRQAPEPVTPADTRPFTFYLFGTTNVADVHDIKLQIALSEAFKIEIERVEIHPTPLDIPDQEMSSTSDVGLSLNIQPSVPNMDKDALPQGENPIVIQTTGGEPVSTSPSQAPFSNSGLLAVHMVREFNTHRERYKDSTPREVIQAIGQRWKQLQSEGCRQVWTSLRNMISSAEQSVSTVHSHDASRRPTLSLHANHSAYEELPAHVRQTNVRLPVTAKSMITAEESPRQDEDVG